MARKIQIIILIFCLINCLNCEDEQQQQQQQSPQAQQEQSSDDNVVDDDQTTSTINSNDEHNEHQHHHHHHDQQNQLHKTLSEHLLNAVHNHHHHLNHHQNDERNFNSYGERLAESAYSYQSSHFHHLHPNLLREPKDESNIYSSGINAILNSDGFLNQMEKFGGGTDLKYRPQGPVEMAVHSKKTIEVIPVKFDENNNNNGDNNGEPQIIEISPYEVPVSIVFKTQTNKLNVNQEHKSEPAEEPKEINSEEEPHRVIHNVYRPVIQEVTEVVQPFRKVIQKVEPVIEEMKTIISKAAPQDGSAVQQQQQQQQQQQLQLQQFRQFGFGDSGKVNRFSEFQPMAYGSEMIGKIESPAPTTITQAPNLLSSSLRSSTPLTSAKNSNENKSILHRFGSESDNNNNINTNNNNNNINDSPNSIEFTNNNDNNNNNIENNNHSSSSTSIATTIIPNDSLKPILEPTEFTDKEANLHYNDIIKQYIDNLLSKQQHQHQQQQKSIIKTPININNMKIMNIPMKSMSMPILSASKSMIQNENLVENNFNNDNNGINNKNDGEMLSTLQPPIHTNSNSNSNNKNDVKKFKVIKEFRISLNDIKKQLGKKHPVPTTAAAIAAITNNPTTNQGHMMMKPYASFSVSGPATMSPKMTSKHHQHHQHLRDHNQHHNHQQRYNRNRSNNMHMQSSQQLHRILKKDGTIAKLNDNGKRRQRNINNGMEPLRSYHYVNLKRYGDISPLILSSPQQQPQQQQHRFDLIQNNQKLSPLASEEHQRQEHVNLYSQNNYQPKYRNDYFH